MARRGLSLRDPGRRDRLVRAARRTAGLAVTTGSTSLGKTTTLRMVTGLLEPDRGSITVFGIDALADPVGAKQIMAWLSDEPMIYDKLTPPEYLHFVAGLWAVESELAEARARDLISWLGLRAYAQERCERLSRGTRGSITVFGIDALADPVGAKQIMAWLSDDRHLGRRRRRHRFGWDEDTCSYPLRRISLPGRDHRPCRLAYFRFPLGLRMVKELLAARGIVVSHETVRQWARKFGQPFAN